MAYPPRDTRGQGGPWDVVYRDGSSEMGFITARPASRKLVSNLAPRITTGGDSRYNSETNDQLVFLGFEVGGDAERFEEADNRYRHSSGGVALHLKDRIQLASQWSETDATQTATCKKIIDFTPDATKSYVVVGVGTKLRIYDSNLSTWANEGTFGASCEHLFANSTYLFVALGSSTDAVRWDGTKTTGWATLTGFKANAFGWYKETLYRALGTNIYSDNSSNAGTAWNAAIPVGWAGTNITDIYEANGLLMIAKPEGLYAYDGSDVYRVIDGRDYYSTTNYGYGAEWQGSLIIPQLNTLQRVALSGARPTAVSAIEMQMRGDASKEQYGHGTPIRVFTGPNRVYFAMNGGEGVYPELLMHNGVGIHQLYRGSSGATMYAAGYSRLMGWLLINDGSTRRKRILNTGDGEYPDFGTTAGWFTTPWADWGFPTEFKGFRALSVETRGCDASNTVLFEYSLDDGDWTSIGTITSDGRHKLPIGGLDGQVAGRKISLRCTLTSSDGGDVTNTPVIELPIILEGVVRPQAIYGYDDILVLDKETALRNNYGTIGTPKSPYTGYTVQQQLDFLDDMADSTNTIVRVDEHGRIRRVQVMNKDENWGGHTASKTDPDHVQVPLRLVEVFSGVLIQDTLTVNFTISTSFSTPSTGYGSAAYGFSTYGRGGA